MLKKVLRVDLREEEVEKFDMYKQSHSYKTDAEAIREMIKQFYLLDQSILIPSELMEKVTRELSNARTKAKYNVWSTEQFVSKAIVDFLEKIKNNRGSLLDWDVRSELTETQLEIATAFIELQKTKDVHSSVGFSLEELSKELHKNKDEIINDLNYLTSIDLIYKIKRGKEQKIHYYAP